VKVSLPPFSAALFLRVALWGLILNALSCAAEMLHGKVVGVADGDTLTLISPDHIQTRIRLFGIDAPEKSQAFGQRSKASLSDLVFGRDVDVIVQTLDRYGRTVGTVIHKGNDINLEQVRQGMAWVYRKYSRDSKYLEAESEARISRRGLWIDEDPMPPWLYRHGETKRRQNDAPEQSDRHRQD
jgi:endonuclease YncB( thermonuclease family)